MKKAFLITATLCLCTVAFAQETAKAGSRYEIKVNLTNALALFPEVGFEYTLKDDLGLGLSLATALDNDLSYSVQFTPYFRFYFGSKPAKTFFIEANAALLGFREDSYSISYDGYSTSVYSNSRKKTVTDFGLGFAVGYKFFNKKNFTGEIYGGLGRTFADRVYPRVGIAVGKQF
ncbi:MAG: PorT family protein [Dysgonamonadaceae bacterium]|jgi:hypothetical protein|nr:PorT family protein [Dysgonamonadaceae bacterium]